MSRPRHDVFLSHHTVDKPLVEALARRLVKAGVRPWIDSWNLIPGEPWQEAIEAALIDCATCAVFIGPSGAGPWQNEELRAAIDRRVTASQDRFRVIPVLLPGAERGERTALPAFLTRTTWVEFRQTLDDDNAFHRLIAGIRGSEPGPGLDAAIYTGTTPYRGLQVFDVADWPFFFGREATIEWLLDALRPAAATANTPRFLGIIGPSGSGKSSLARAGLVAALTQGRLPGSVEWPIVVCKPGADPLENLAIELCVATGAAHDVTAVQQLRSNLLSDPSTLHLTTRLALREAPADRRLVVLVDQFEEAWTLCHDDALREAVIAALLHAATVVGGQAIVLLTLRADFYGKCATDPALAAALSDHHMLVTPMQPDELRLAIERPARLAGSEFEPGLVDTLLDDVAGQPGSLPLLQHALLELWNRQTNRRLTHAAYREIGGVAGALERRAETVFAALNEVEQALCRRIFLRLTQPGEGAEDTRRRAALHELLPNGADAHVVEAVVQRLADDQARLITTESATDQSATQYIEVSHEALIRSWGRLRGWIAADRAALRVQHQLAEAAAEWDRNRRDPSYLYQGARLAQAREWAEFHADDLNAQERSFLDASLASSEAATRAARRRVRWTIGGLTSALLIISVFAGVAVWFWRNAEIAARLDRARLLVEQGRREAEQRPLLGLRLTLEGLAQMPAERADARQALVQTLAQLAAQGQLLHLADDVEEIFTSPDGATAVFRYAEAPSELRRLDTGAVTPLPGHVVGADYSPDSASLVIAYDNASAELRQLNTGAVTPLPGHVVGADYSPDSRSLVIHYENAPPDLRQLDTGAVTRLPGRILSTNYSPDSASLVIHYENAITELRQLPSGSVMPLPRRILTTYYSPDRTSIVTHYADGSDELRWVDTGAVTSLPGQVIRVDYSPNSRSLVIRYPDAPAELHQLDTGAITPLPDLVDVEGATYSPNGRSLVTAYNNTPGELRQLDTGAVTRLSNKVVGVDYSPDSANLVISYVNTPGELRQLATGAVTPLSGLIARVYYSPNSHSLVIMYGDGFGELRRLDTGAVTPLPHESSYSDVIYSPDSASLVISYVNTPGVLLRLDTDTVTPLSGLIASAAYSPDGSTVIIAYADAPGEVWSTAAAPQRLATLDVVIPEGAFVVQGKRLLVSSTTKQVYLLDVAWLQAMHGDPAALPEAELVRLACTMPLASGFWTEQDQAALEQALAGAEQRACCEETQ